MNRSKVVRALRIAWSVAWGIACVLLIAAACFFHPAYPPSPKPPQPDGHCWNFRFTQSQTLITETFDDWTGDWRRRYAERRKLRTIDYLGFNRQAIGSQYLWAIPHWFPVALSMIAGYWAPTVLSFARRLATRLSLRFSLRTLLIATTLIAVGLGLIAWLSR
jgi:hypothetical protein